MSLAVIGAGLPRTGTMSLKLALDRLGLGPCCHVYEMLKPENVGLNGEWERFFDGGPFDWEAIFRGFNSAVDSPTCYFYRTLAAAYPDAKLILTLRDPQSWIRSIQATISAPEVRERFMSNPSMARFLTKMRDASRKESSESPEPDPDADYFERLSVEFFEYHNDQVKRVIAPQRLLVFEVKEGWEPLCRFLDLPIPDEPFPQKNATVEFQQAHSGLHFL